jgi:hypothetical protein
MTIRSRIARFVAAVPGLRRYPEPGDPAGRPAIVGAEVVLPTTGGHHITGMINIDGDVIDAGVVYTDAEWAAVSDRHKARINRRHAVLTFILRARFRLGTNDMDERGAAMWRAVETPYKLTFV